MEEGLLGKGNSIRKCLEVLESLDIILGSNRKLLEDLGQV